MDRDGAARSAQIAIRGDTRTDASASMVNWNLQMMARVSEHSRGGCGQSASNPQFAKPPISTLTERRLKVHACQALSARSTICVASAPSSRVT
jgi:hypothetical protein